MSTRGRKRSSSSAKSKYYQQLVDAGFTQSEASKKSNSKTAEFLLDLVHEGVPKKIALKLVEPGRGASKGKFRNKKEEDQLKKQYIVENNPSPFSYSKNEMKKAVDADWKELNRKVERNLVVDIIEREKKFKESIGKGNKSLTKELREIEKVLNEQRRSKGEPIVKLKGGRGGGNYKPSAAAIAILKKQYVFNMDLEEALDKTLDDDYLAEKYPELYKLFSVS